MPEKPHEFAAEAAYMLFAARAAEYGSWPVAGGWMDQTEACIAGVRATWRDRALFERELMRG